VRKSARWLYRASPASVVTEMEALEMSLVRRPATPEARLLALPVARLVFRVDSALVSRSACLCRVKNA
jgi:hypothetical protein